MRYLNRLVILLLVLCLTGCTGPNIRQPDKEPDPVDYDYIEPATVSLFSLLSDDLRSKMAFANNGNELEDYQLLMFGKELFSGRVQDYYGNTVDFSTLKDKKVVFEIMQENCAHCKSQVKKSDASFKNAAQDAIFIKFFFAGNKEGIDAFYEDAGVKMSQGDIVIPENETLKDYVRSLDVRYTPTFLCFNNGHVTWSADGEVTASQFKNFEKLAFEEEPLKLVNKDGKSIFEASRTAEDVMMSLSENSIKKLEDLDNDGYTPKMTYDYMGRKVDWTKLSDGNDRVRCDVKDWTYYEGRDVALYFVRLSGDKMDDFFKLRPINLQINYYQDVKAIILIIEDGVSSMELFESYGYTMYGAVVSSEAPIPLAYATLDIYEFPTVIFTENSTITGAYSSVAGEDELYKAVDMFIGPKSIAHSENN